MARFALRIDLVALRPSSHDRLVVRTLLCGRSNPGSNPGPGNVIQSIFWIRSDEGLTLETSAFRIPVRWPIYIINSVDKTKFLYVVKPAILMFSFPKSLSNVCKKLYEYLINKNCFLFR